MFLLKSNLLISYTVIIAAILESILGCHYIKAQEGKAKNNSVVTFSQEEEQVLLSGIGSLLYKDLKSDNLYKLSDYLLIESVGNFSDSYSKSDSTDLLIKKFINLNKKIIGKPVTVDRFLNVQTVKQEKLDSLEQATKRTDFWHSFHNKWYPDKAGILEISKPVIKEDKAFFWFSNMENGKSGRVMKVWMRKIDNHWNVEKGEVVIWF